MKIFITGVSRGIGKELVTKLLERGDEVWGVARAKHLDDSHPRFTYSSCDITSETAMQAVVVEMEQKGFYPEVVILNAGIEKPDTKAGYDYAVGQEIFRTNYDGAMYWVDRFLRFKLPPKQFVAVSSVFAQRPNEHSISYSASKAALSMIFRGLRLQFVSKQIKFKLIYLLGVDTLIKPSYEKYMTKKPPFFVISPAKAAAFIINSLSQNKDSFYSHYFLSLAIRLTQVMPDRLFMILTSPFRR